MSKKDLDQFFTKPHIAILCWESVKPIIVELTLKTFEDLLFIEPSAGTGSFYDVLPKEKIGIDIEARRYEFIHRDFLKMNWEINFPREYRVIIGNPPFGRRGKKAVDFFIKAATLADTIGFILPAIFRKYFVHKQLPFDWQLVHRLPLPRNSFYTDDANDFEVNAEFQLWTRLPNSRENFRVSTPPPQFLM